MQSIKNSQHNKHDKKVVQSSKVVTFLRSGILMTSVDVSQLTAYIWP